MSGSLLPFGLILAATACGLLVPLFLHRRAAVVTRADSASAVLEDRLTQLSRDREAGLIGAAEAAAAEAETARALIATRREADAERGYGTGGPAGMIGAAAVAFAIGIAVYWSNGSWTLPDRPIAEAESAGTAGAPSMLTEHEGTAMAEAIASLQARLDKDPGNADNLHLLARSYTAVGDYGGAAAAYAQLIKLLPLRIELRGDYGEAIVRAEQGFVGPRAAEAFEVILAHAPDDPRALYYLALRNAQNGDAQKAAEGWARILKTAPADASYRPAVSQILEAIVEDAGLDRAALGLASNGDAPTDLPSAPGPTPEQTAAAAALPAGEQMAMIRGMIDRLEARLAEEPGDIDGWLRLARSRAVLGEIDNAAVALERALRANPGDPRLLAAFEEIGNSAR